MSVKNSNDTVLKVLWQREGYVATMMMEDKKSELM